MPFTGWVTLSAVPPDALVANAAEVDTDAEAKSGSSTIDNESI